MRGANSVAIEVDRLYVLFMGNDERLDRKAPPHKSVVRDGNRSSIILVTVCTHARQPVLATAHAHDLLIRVWTSPSSWIVGRYVVLPDHVHLFCAPLGLEPPPLSRWVATWKASVSKRWEKPEQKPLWQRSFWDRQLRSGESYSGRWQYVRNNPVRHKLTETTEQWPYQGELNLLHWHEP